MLNTRKSSEVCAPLRSREVGIIDESNHNSTEHNQLLEQERFVWMEITIILGKNGGYKTSGLGSR